MQGRLRDSLLATRLFLWTDAWVQELATVRSCLLAKQWQLPDFRKREQTLSKSSSQYLLPFQQFQSVGRKKKKMNISKQQQQQLQRSNHRSNFGNFLFSTSNGQPSLMCLQLNFFISWETCYILLIVIVLKKDFHQQTQF